MVRPSQTEKDAAAKRILESQVRDCYGRVVYSHKTHEKCADILSQRLGRIKLSQIILSAITTAGFVVAIIGDNQAGVIAGAVISTALLVLNAYTKDHDLGELAQKHRQAASDLWLVREEYLSLLVDIRSGDVSMAELRKRRDDLLERLHGVYGGSPDTTVKAYRKAQAALKTQEELTFSDQEIDAFLPENLRILSHGGDNG